MSSKAPAFRGAVRRRLLGAGLAVVCAALTAPVAAAALPTRAQLRRDVDRAVAAGVPGVIVLARDGRRTVRVAGGAARLAPRQAMRVDDRFRIASLTKSYVATVTLQLAGEGRLSLHDPVERWLPGMVPNGQSITLRELLNHHSGLFDYFNDPRVLEPFLKGDLAHTWTPEQLVAVSVAHPPVFAPGARPPAFPTGRNAAYSNTNYILLGLVIQKVTGRSIGTELAERIFAPLGLRATSFATGQRIAGRHAHGYFYASPGRPLDSTAASPTHSWAAGAIVSTAGDVATFYRALLSGRLLGPALLRSMLTVTDGYGLGIGPRPGACPVRWGHEGEVAGYNSVAVSTRDGRRQFVMLYNAHSPRGGFGTARGRRALERLFRTGTCSG
ncbi:MAG: D-alanyl-D-alanine carboxypeptidase [Solirubrobacteraceae bacterium]|nr:D-alanyl-D-alanine carboxypeptidase [Solirubrobacteraceae bacterium]